jgi:hypothetical protein
MCSEEADIIDDQQMMLQALYEIISPATGTREWNHNNAQENDS